jgi:hypothetical protein
VDPDEAVRDRDRIVPARRRREEVPRSDPPAPLG